MFQNKQTYICRNLILQKSFKNEKWTITNRKLSQKSIKRNNNVKQKKAWKDYIYIYIYTHTKNVMQQ